VGGPPNKLEVDGPFFKISNMSTPQEHEQMLLNMRIGHNYPFSNRKNEGCDGPGGIGRQLWKEKGARKEKIDASENATFLSLSVRSEKSQKSELDEIDVIALFLKSLIKFAVKIHLSKNRMEEFHLNEMATHCLISGSFV
ncbi:hypothetical protein ACTXT7_011082, partial [Hymenolepis weldensis]